jgi:hypothetical protein
MSRPTLEPFRQSGTGQVKYKLGIDGARRQLIFSAAELEALQSLIQRVQEDSHGSRIT